MKKLMLTSITALSLMMATQTAFAESSLTISDPHVAEFSIKLTVPDINNTSYFEYSGAYRAESTSPYNRFISEEKPNNFTFTKGSNDNYKFTFNTSGTSVQEENELKYTSLVTELTYDIDPDDITIDPTYSPEIRKYIESSPKIQSNDPAIIAKSNEIADGEKNPYLITVKIFNFVNEFMHYDLTRGNVSALNALQTGYGVCEDYSELMIALLRAQHIPARPVSGVRISQYEKSIDPKNKDTYRLHMWVEVYFDKIGWVPSDPTRGNDVFTDHTKPIGTISDYYYFPLSFTDPLRWYYRYQSYPVKPTLSYYLDLKDEAPIETKAIDISVGSTDATSGDDALTLEAEPYLIGQTVMVPAETIANALGFTINYNRGNEKLLINTDTKQGVLFGYTDSLFGGMEIKLPTKPILDGKIPFIPIETFKALGIDIHQSGEVITLENYLYNKKIIFP